MSKRSRLQSHYLSKLLNCSHPDLAPLMLLPMKVERSDQQATVDNAILGLAMLIAFGLYFLPTIIVEIRRTEHSAGILGMNLIFGWTVLGWIAALIWPLAQKDSRKVSQWGALVGEGRGLGLLVNEDSAIYQNDHWMLGIEDFIKSDTSSISRILSQH
jgi:T4 superinfection immunity protein